MKTRSHAQIHNDHPPDDDEELHRLKALFEKRPAVRKHRIKKEKPLKRHNKKVDDYDMEKIRIMRDEHHYTYEVIGRKLNMRAQTVYMALRRFHSRQNQHIDTRLHNGRSTPRKITPVIEAFLLDRDTLQSWSGYTLGRRVAEIEKKFNVRVGVATLQDFYKKHTVKYGVSSYQYVQAMNEKSFHTVRKLAVKLAKMIAQEDLNLVYFDEASFNLWMRHRKTWGM